MGSIKLHPKHGLNCTIPVCIFCGKEKNEIAMLGASYKEEAPRRMIINRDPCQSCEEAMATGIAFIECEKEGPTGTFIVFKEDAEFLQHIQPEDLRLAIMEKRKAFVRPEDWDAMGFPRSNVDNREKT